MNHLEKHTMWDLLAIEVVAHTQSAIKAETFLP